MPEYPFWGVFMQTGSDYKIIGPKGKNLDMFFQMINRDRDSRVTIEDNRTGNWSTVSIFFLSCSAPLQPGRGRDERAHW